MRTKSVFLVFIISSFLFAASQQSFVQVMLNVKNIFELNIDRNLIDFKTLNPGEVKRDMPDNEGVKIGVKCNSGRPWYLKISDLSELSNGSDNIPNANFYWYGAPSKLASGVWHGTGEDSFSLTPILAYAAGRTEYNNLPDGTDLFFKFAVKVPARQNSGTYRSVIAFTLTE